MKKKKCYIYTRVSTLIQTDGYSLDAQKDKLMKYAAYQDMEIVGEYSDAGRSGKNIEGRPDFQRMLSDIENEKDDITFVLVFKLSRFGRNAADVLSSLQLMQDHDVNLICVEDGIDSSKDSGKLVISVLSAVAEIERENILVQTMEGRKQKAREGGWNGGFAPYGYKLIDGKLEIAEDEAEAIRVIYDKYVNTTMGMNSIAKYMNEQGYVKKQRQNGSLSRFSYAFIQDVLDNPVYMGKLAYGRRKSEKIKGERNKFHIVKQDEFPIYEGQQDAIVSVDLWYAAKSKREATGGKREKKYGLEHAHLLSGILKCPVCGAGMYGGRQSKQKKDGSYYDPYYYYFCKHRLQVDGHVCTFKKQIKQEKINGAVEELLFNIVKNEKFASAMKARIGSQVDTTEIEQERENLRKFQRQLEMSKDRLGKQIDLLDPSDRLYNRKYEDMSARLDRLYEDIAEVDDKIDELTSRIQNIHQEQINADSVYNYLLLFEKYYNQFTDIEKKEFMNTILEKVEIFDEVQEDGRILKAVYFKFPVFFDGLETKSIFLDKLRTVETVVLLGRKFEKSREHVYLDYEPSAEIDLPGGATYSEIKQWIQAEYDLKVSSLYVAQVKQKHGIVERECYNKPKSENAKQPKCPPEKEAAIEAALKHFKMI